MQYNPVFYQGDIAQEIHAAILEANRTAERKLLRVEDNIKFDRVLTSISGDIAWQDYKEKIRESDIDALSAANDWRFGDRKITPVKMMAFDNVTMDQLRKTRFGEDMAAGANNIGSTAFERAATGYLVPRMGKSYEKMTYSSISATSKAQIAASATPSASEKAWAAAQPNGRFDGLVASLIMAGVEDAANKVKSVPQGGVPTTATLPGLYAALFQAIDAAELENGQVVIFAPLSDFQIIIAANQARDFKDTFIVEGKGKDAKVWYNTVMVEFVPTPGRFAGYAGETGDFVHGTDLLSDVDEFKIDKVNAMGDDLFFKMVATSCTTVLNASKKVLSL